MAKVKYYSIKKLWDTGADVMLCFGQRSSGKTYQALLKALERYKDKKERFCYIRRWAEDIKTANAQKLFLPLQDQVEHLFGKGYTIHYWQKTFYLMNPDGEKEPIGYITCLSESHHVKSVPFVDTTLIILDEFISMAGEKKLDSEISRYENILSTIIRLRQDVKVLLLANTVQRYSPFFIYYSIAADKMTQGEILVKEFPNDSGTLKVAAEYCEYNEDVGKNSSKYIIQSDMIKKGYWEIRPTSDIPSMPEERVKERMIFSIYDPDSDMIIGIYLRTSQWFTLEKSETSPVQTMQKHKRQFLVVKPSMERSTYFHLTDQKSLDYHTYNDLKLMLKDIEESTTIDFGHELYMGRVFAYDAFIADNLSNCLERYCKITSRELL